MDFCLDSLADSVCHLRSRLNVIFICFWNMLRYVFRLRRPAQLAKQVNYERCRGQCIDVSQNAQTSCIGVESLRIVAAAPDRASHAVYMLLVFSEFSRLLHAFHGSLVFGLSEWGALIPGLRGKSHKQTI